MRRLKQWRTLVVVTALACGGLLAYAAVASADPPPLTPAQLGEVVAEVTLAVSLEQSALSQIADTDFRDAGKSLHDSSKLLAHASFLSRKLSPDVVNDIAGAFHRDDAAEFALENGNLPEAIAKIQEGLALKAAALSILVPQPLEACFFDPNLAQVDVKVGEQGQGGAAGTVIFAAGSTPQTLTFTLDPTTSTAVVGPFFAPSASPTGTITVNLTALGGQSQTTTIPWTPTAPFATDCNLPQ
jgi:hypothetical protein